MQSYLQLLKQTFNQGTRQKNRTGIDSFMIPGGMMQFDLANGFPILTTKRVAFRQVVGELLGFIRGYSNAEDFRRLGCHVWDANANKNTQWLENPYRKGNDDLGRIYGVQWRDWNGTDGRSDGFDQLRRALELLKQDPTSRRNIVTAWNPTELHVMSLPPCHLLFQLLVEQGRGALHMTMYMRSCDMFIGVPFNISSYALLLALIAKATGYEPGRLTMFLADVHIYENHLDQVKLQLTREPRSRPMLNIVKSDPADFRSPIAWLENIDPGEIELEGYDPHPPIKGEMAV